MKTTRSIFFVIFLFLICVETNAQSKLNAFLQHFPIQTEELILPLETEVIIGKEHRKLNNEDIRAYLLNNNQPDREEKLARYYRYFPIARFPNSDLSFFSLVYKMEGSAGGVEEMYVICTLDRHGNVIDELICAREAADCSFTRGINCKISGSQILMESYNWETDCDTAEIISKSEEKTEEYIILDNGKIELKED